MSENKKEIYNKKSKYIFIRKMKLPKFKLVEGEADFGAKFDSAQILDVREKYSLGRLSLSWKYGGRTLITSSSLERHYKGVENRQRYM